MIRKGTLADVWMETSTGAAGTAEPGLEVPAQNSRARPEDKDLASVVSLSLSLSAISSGTHGTQSICCGHVCEETRTRKFTAAPFTTPNTDNDLNAHK